jgi:hypothetical protein
VLDAVDAVVDTDVDASVDIGTLDAAVSILDVFVSAVDESSDAEMLKAVDATEVVGATVTGADVSSVTTSITVSPSILSVSKPHTKHERVQS